MLTIINYTNIIERVVELILSKKIVNNDMVKRKC